MPEEISHIGGGSQSQIAFVQRQITGLDARLGSVEQAIISLVWHDGNFIKRHAEVFIFAAFVGGYFFSHLIGKG